MRTRSYSELIRLNTFEERFDYLKTTAIIGEKTFGFNRPLNQHFYQSNKWKRVRRDVIARDLGCDMALEGFDIYDMVIVHHINPISAEDVEYDRDCLYDMENLVCVTDATHKAIHYGTSDYVKDRVLPNERSPHDTSPWRG